MDPLKRLSSGEWRQVLRLAAQMHTRDEEREAAERLRQEYVRAAAEVGLTEEYLHRAARKISKQRPAHVWRTGVLVAVSTTGLLAGSWGLRWAARPQMAGEPLPEALSATAIAPVEATTHGQSVPTRVKPSAYTTTASGLKYVVLREGSGAGAQAGQELNVHYTGWLASSDEKFDSSVDRGEVFTFTLGRGLCILGWEEGLAGMKVREKRQLVIPPDLGYGESGTPGGGIPPNAALVFEVELVRIGE